MSFALYTIFTSYQVCFKSMFKATRWRNQS